MTNELCLDEKFCQLSEKEMFFSPLEKGAYFNRQSGKTIGEKQQYRTDAIGTQSVVLLVNEQNPETIAGLEQKSDLYGGGLSHKIEGMVRRPFYLYYDEEQFIKFVQDNDISLICEKYRIVVLVGMEYLKGFFCQLDTIYPDIILGDEDGRILGELAEIAAERNKAFQEIKRELSAYYQINGEKIKQRIMDGSARICILKNYFEPKKFKELCYQLKISLEKIGYNVQICDERGPIFWTQELVNLHRYMPDIVFQINKARDGRTYQGESLRLENLDNLVYINWVQDLHPAILNKEYAGSLKRRDFIFSLFDRNIMQEYGYGDENVIYRGIMPADSANFRVRSVTEEEHRRFDYDLCFLGTIFDERFAVNYIYRELMPFLMDEQIEKVCDILFDVLTKIYDSNTQRYHSGLDILRESADRAQKELGCDDTVRLYVYRLFSVIRYNSMRKLILKQLAGQKRYRIILYGEHDVNIEGVDFGGFISDRVELSKALQCCKILIQINSDATMNQRVVEGLLSHTMALVYKMDAEDDMSNIAQYLDENEGICYFRNKYELICKCDLLLNDEDLREEITEAGYQKAVDTLTSDNIFHCLMEDLKKKFEITDRKVE